MPETGASAAVTEATRLPEIGFAEFTSKLITDVFAALIDANLKQVASYMDLVNAMATTLKDFIANTVDNITIEQALLFLDSVWPGIRVGRPLSVEAVNALNLALALPTEAGTVNTLDRAQLVDAGGNLTQDGFDQKLVPAIRRRLATNRYNILHEMVRQGILRLVVDNGVIETRLTFNTYGYTSSENSKSKEVRDSSLTTVGGIGGVGSIQYSPNTFWGAGVGAFAGLSTVFGVSTARESSRDVNGSSVQIYGRVEIRFKTDYVPLRP